MAFGAVILLAFSLNFHTLIHTPNPASVINFKESSLGTWQWLYTFYNTHTFIFLGLSLVVHILLAIYINAIINREQFYKHKNTLPALCYVLYLGLFPDSFLFSIPLLSASILFISFILLMNLSKMQYPRRTILNIGIAIGISILIYFPSLFFIIAFLLTILILRAIVLEEIIALLIGMCIPVLFFIGLQYSFGSTERSCFAWKSLIILPTKGLQKSSVIEISILLISLLYAYMLVQKPANYPIQLKKKWTALSIYAFVAVLVGLLSTYVFANTWIIALIPFSIILSMCFFHKQEIYNNFTFYLLLLLILIKQWVFK